MYNKIKCNKLANWYNELLMLSGTYFTGIPPPK